MGGHKGWNLFGLMKNPKVKEKIRMRIERK
jgi:hypothetical protein